MIADHDELESSVAALLLGSLEPDEEDAVRAHLEGCSRCQAAARRLRLAIGELPLAADPAQPPERLRERILAAAAVARPQSTARPVRPPARLGPRSVAPAWFRRVRIPAGAAAAAVVALALGLGAGLGIGHQLAPTQPPANGVVQHSMQGSGVAASAQGRVFELRQVGVTLVEFSGLPQPSDGKVYQLWLIPDHGNPISAGVFVPDSAGGHTVVVGRDLTGLKALAVTQEAAPDGAPAPTQTPEISGSV